MTPTAPKRLGRPRDADSAETRQRLLEEARRTFAAVGYARTTNRQIADAAGITPGAIYHYVPSKAGLYAAVYDEVQEQVRDAFSSAIAGRETLAERFCALLQAGTDLNRADPSLAGFLAGVAAEVRTHPELAALLQPARTPTIDLVHGLVVDAEARGELGDLPPPAVEDALNVVLTGLARWASLTGDADRHASTVAVLQQLFSEALCRNPGRTPGTTGAP